MTIRYLLVGLSLLFIINHAVAEQKQVAHAKPASVTQPKPIMVKASDPFFQVELKANPATGFSWFLTQYNSDLVTPVSAKYHPPKKVITGAPGHTVWKFKLTQAAFVVPHIIEIRLRYMQPWAMVGGKHKLIVVVTR